MQSKQFRRILFRGMLVALILVLLPLAAGFGVFGYKAHQIVADTRPALNAPLPPLPTSDPSKRIAVVLLSNNGTEITTRCRPTNCWPPPARSTPTLSRPNGASRR